MSEQGDLAGADDGGTVVFSTGDLHISVQAVFLYTVAKIVDYGTKILFAILSKFIEDDRNALVTYALTSSSGFSCAPVAVDAAIDYDLAVGTVVAAFAIVGHARDTGS